MRALDGISLQLWGGQFVSVVGPSGPGKSTLLHLLGALDSPDFGSIWNNAQGEPSWATVQVEFYNRYLWPTKIAAKLAAGNWSERVYKPTPLGHRYDQPGRVRESTYSDGTSRLTASTSSNWRGFEGLPRSGIRRKRLRDANFGGGGGGDRQCVCRAPVGGWAYGDSVRPGAPAWRIA